MEIQNNVVNEEIKIDSTETNQVEVKEEKTFTQEELDKILNKKFAQWQKKTEEAIVGKNMPPLHPNCRSCMIPIIE